MMHYWRFARYHNEFKRMAVLYLSDNQLMGTVQECVIPFTGKFIPWADMPVCEFLNNNSSFGQ